MRVNAPIRLRDLFGIYEVRRFSGKIAGSLPTDEFVANHQIRQCAFEERKGSVEDTTDWIEKVLKVHKWNVCESSGRQCWTLIEDNTIDAKLEVVRVVSTDPVGGDSLMNRTEVANMAVAEVLQVLRPLVQLVVGQKNSTWLDRGDDYADPLTVALVCRARRRTLDQLLPATLGFLAPLQQVLDAVDVCQLVRFGRAGVSHPHPRRVLNGVGGLDTLRDLDNGEHAADLFRNLENADGRGDGRVDARLRALDNTLLEPSAFHANRGQHHAVRPLVSVHADDPDAANCIGERGDDLRDVDGLTLVLDSNALGERPAEVKHLLVHDLSQRHVEHQRLPQQPQLCTKRCREKVPDTFWPPSARICGGTGRILRGHGGR